MNAPRERWPRAATPPMPPASASVAVTSAMIRFMEEPSQAADAGTTYSRRCPGETRSSSRLADGVLGGVGDGNAEGAAPDEHGPAGAGVGHVGGHLVVLRALVAPEPGELDPVSRALPIGRRARGRPGSRAPARCRCPRARPRTDRSARGRSTRRRWRRGRSRAARPSTPAPAAGAGSGGAVALGVFGAPSAVPGAASTTDSGIGNASTTFLSTSVGTTSTTTAAIASTERTAARAGTLRSTRGRITNDSSSQPASSTAFTTTARVLITPDLTAFGCTTSITSIPPNRITWGIASSASDRCERASATQCRFSHRELRARPVARRKKSSAVARWSSASTSARVRRGWRPRTRCRSRTDRAATSDDQCVAYR